MFLHYALRRLKLRSICIAVSLVSLLYIFYQFKASEVISNDQFSFTEPPEQVAFPSDISLRGIHPNALHKYKPDSDGMFTCLQSGEKISLQKVNDDYCDCTDDGSDEPGTSACGFNLFHCKKSKRGDHFILTSRVNDGICDCCDGSDEYLKLKPPMIVAANVQRKLGRYLSPCSNRC